MSYLVNARITLGVSNFTVFDWLSVNLHGLKILDGSWPFFRNCR
jgi:hypothetical protein